MHGGLSLWKWWPSDPGTEASDFHCVYCGFFLSLTSVWKTEYSAWLWNFSKSCNSGWNGETDLEGTLFYRFCFYTPRGTQEALKPTFNCLSQVIKSCQFSKRAWINKPMQNEGSQRVHRVMWANHWCLPSPSISAGAEGLCLSLLAVSDHFMKFATELAGCHLRTILFPSYLKIVFLGRKEEEAGDWRRLWGEGQKNNYLVKQHMFTR